ncbi:alpha/beta-hydrolase [Daedaleopsis nitida]|nr:alpha/beta-hydrolase [Daedaleopsis nitida]
MEEHRYNTVTVRRGHLYRYYYSPPGQRKLVLLFLHGFPSSSYDWHKQVVYFEALGYGTLVPDLLGAGGSTKPLEPTEFRLNSMSEDIVDVLESAGVERVVGISHDWGSVLMSRLSMLNPDIFHGFAWLGLGYMEPIMSHFDLDATMAQTKSILGYEGYAYWQFFTRDDAYQLIETNVDSFIQLLYPQNPDDWLTYMALPGKTAECIENNMQLGSPSYLDRTEYETLRFGLLRTGVRSALNWYKAQVNDVDLADNRNISPEMWQVQAPSLMVVALRDCICTPMYAKMAMIKFGTKVDYLQVPSGHWPQLECASSVNDGIRQWLERMTCSIPGL